MSEGGLSLEVLEQLNYALNCSEIYKQVQHSSF